jgi:hypothetical protein
MDIYSNAYRYAATFLALATRNDDPFLTPRTSFNEDSNNATTL